MASVGETIHAINTACRSRGGVYAQYSCKSVSWDDVARGNVGGSLSCWGANITDTRLWAKDGRQLFTVRSDNWNEKLGAVSTSDVAVVVGNCAPGGTGELHPITLRDLLSNLGSHAAYAGIAGGSDLAHKNLDAQVSIRFQTTFLPVGEEDLAAMEFCSEAYNYNTTSDSDPRNLILLCTTQGLAVQQDGSGAKRLFHHAVDKHGGIHRYWLEAERSRHKVGGPQQETAEEREAAAARGKATASVIGVRSLGTRFNVLMNIQVPLQQQAAHPKRGFSLGGLGGFSFGLKKKKSKESKSSILLSMECSDSLECAGGCDDSEDDMNAGGYDDAVDCVLQSGMSAPQMACAASAPRGRMRGCVSRSAKVGTANAARVSRGSEFDTWKGLSVNSPKRNDSEHVTVTVVIYNTISGGVPSEADVVAAVDDLEALYASCSVSGRLADDSFDFMKKELTVNDVTKITEKVQAQPYVPPSQAVANFDQFPGA